MLENFMLKGVGSDVFGEVATLFPDPYVSLGGDEAWLTPWTCSPPVKQWMAAKNFTLDAAAHYYEQQLFSIVSGETGAKQTMMWAPGEAVVSNSTIHIVWTGWPQNGPSDGWKNDFASLTAKGQPVVRAVALLPLPFNSFPHSTVQA